MFDTNVINLLLVTGAAGAFFLVLKWLADGKFHTHSEVEGLRADKKLLIQINKDQAEALKSSNSAHERALDTISILRQRLGDPVPAPARAPRRRKVDEDGEP